MNEIALTIEDTAKDIKAVQNAIPEVLQQLSVIKDKIPSPLTSAQSSTAEELLPEILQKVSIIHDTVTSPPVPAPAQPSAPSSPPARFFNVPYHRARNFIGQDKPMTTFDGMAQAVFEMLRNTNIPFLVVLDNLGDPTLLAKARQCLPASPNSSVIITTRIQQVLELATVSGTMEIDSITEDDAMRLFFQSTKRSQDATVSDRLSAETIVRELCQHPLAVTQAGHFVHRKKMDLRLFMSQFEKLKLSILCEIPQMTDYYAKLGGCEIMTALNVFTAWQISASFAIFCSIVNPWGSPKEMSQETGSFLAAYLGNWGTDIFSDILSEFADLGLIQEFHLGYGGYYRATLHKLVKDLILLRLTRDQRSQYEALEAEMMLQKIGAAKNQTEIAASDSALEPEPAATFKHQMEELRRLAPSLHPSQGYTALDCRAMQRIIVSLAENGLGQLTFDEVKEMFCVTSERMRDVTTNVAASMRLESLYRILLPLIRHYGLYSVSAIANIYYMAILYRTSGGPQNTGIAAAIWRCAISRRLSLVNVESYQNSVTNLDQDAMMARSAQELGPLLTTPRNYEETQGHLERAFIYYERTEDRLRLNTIEALGFLAEALSYQGRREEAIRYCQSAIRRHVLADRLGCLYMLEISHFMALQMMHLKDYSAAEGIVRALKTSLEE
ncbi:hypothetical protein B0H63DRAFT_518785 [Podospora didyma]|uniref:NB-ARC domain-containing protein n=1 Tax=Podospora didyma TaxID=330526 RepID=A0AAE0NXQ0_9PEZI|nr:hypothetical protein B0H63DRAFT_518785 [Podospora didyma]